MKRLIMVVIAVAVSGCGMTIGTTDYLRTLGEVASKHSRPMETLTNKDRAELDEVLNGRTARR